LQPQTNRRADCENFASAAVQRRVNAVQPADSVATDCPLRTTVARSCRSGSEIPLGGALASILPHNLLTRLILRAGHWRGKLDFAETKKTFGSQRLTADMGITMIPRNRGKGIVEVLSP
jgi:hypothetical protein